MGAASVPLSDPTPSNQRILELYSGLHREHGDSARSVHMSDRATQRRRFEILYEVSPALPAGSILDVGCGLAHLHEHGLELGFRGDYSGIDLNPEFVAACRAKFPEQRFARWDIASGPPPWRADFVLLNGVFNDTRPDPWGFLTTALRHMFAVTDQALAFNVMSTYVDFLHPLLDYFDPGEVFRFLKEELSPLVTLRHDYCVKPGVVPYDLTFYVYRSEIAPRRRHAPREAGAEPA